MVSRLLLVISIASILALSEETSILSATYSSLNVEITTTYQVPTSTVVPIESSTVIPERTTSAEITPTVQVPSSTVISIESSTVIPERTTSAEVTPTVQVPSSTIVSIVSTSIIPVVTTSPGMTPTPTQLPVVCDEGDVRLIDGSTPSEGRIEICSSNTWLVVCDNPFNTERENRDHLICRQLGYTNVLHKLRGLSQGSASYLLQDLNCTGTESNLLECASSDITESECNVAGVACENVVDGCRIYPSYLNFDNDVCEETCPVGTFGVTNGTVDDLTTDRLRACTPVPNGYFVLLNATQYEFDVDCNSPNGTVVFKASIFLEDVVNTVILGARLFGAQAPHFLINGVPVFTVSGPSLGSIISLTISFAQPLNCSSETLVWILQLQTTAFDHQQNICQDTSNVIIYKRPSAISSSVPAPTLSSVPAPTTSPVVVPTMSSVPAPTVSSVAAPTLSSVAAPTMSSVAAPTMSSVAAPTLSSVATPTMSSVAAPTLSSVAAPTMSSVAAPTTSSVAAPTLSSVAVPTTSSVAVPTMSSVAAPTLSSVAVPTMSSVPAPTLSSVPAPTLSSVPAPTLSSVPAPTLSSVAIPTLSSVPAPTLSSVAVPTMSSVPAPTLSSVAVPTKSSVPAPTLSSVPAPTMSSVPAPTLSSVPSPTLSSVAAPTLSSVAAPTTSSMMMSSSTSVPATTTSTMMTLSPTPDGGTPGSGGVSAVSITLGICGVVILIVTIVSIVCCCSYWRTKATRTTAKSKHTTLYALDELKMDTNPAYVMLTSPSRQNINSTSYINTMVGGEVIGTDDYIYDVINDDYYTDILNDQNVKMTQNPAYMLQENHY